MSKKALDEVIKASIRKSFPVAEAAQPTAGKPVVNEAYVAQPKAYSQVSEFSSQKTKDAHQRLYKSCIERLNTISAKIDSAVTGDTSSDTSAYRSLKADEAHLLNAVYFHELFFANCFDPHSEIYMDSKVYLRLARDFGSFEQWQTDFIACSMSARDGWAVTGYNVFLKRFVNTVVDSNANNVQVGLVPVIVVDMSSHAFFRDYLDDKRSYIVAKMREVNWEVVEERIVRCDKIAEALK